MANTHSLDSLRAEHFREARNTRFRVIHTAPEEGTPASSEIELIDVTESPASDTMGTFRRPFSVLFHGPLDPVLPQAIYRLEQERFGALELFLVPVGPDEAATAMRYEAVFG